MTEAQQQILIDTYPVNEPFVRIGISQEPDGSNRYIVVEPRLTKKEREQFAELKKALKNGLEIDVASFEPGKAVRFLSEQTQDITKKFGIRIPKDSYAKIFYFIERDFLHYGKLDPMMRDPNIEDISCNGPELPIFVFHRTYESIPTNVSFKTQEELEKFVLRLAYMSGRSISVADPVVDAALPDGSRIQMTFGSEITKKGSTFTVRKFKEDPYSIIDLIRFGTIDAEIAAFMWLMLENKFSVLMAGGTASGKSIRGDESVYVYESGVPHLVRVSSLFNRLARGRPISKEGEYEVVSGGGLEAVAFGTDLKTRRFGVSRVIRHPAPRRVYKIRTRSGREAVTTGDHSIFSLFDGEVREYRVSALEPGMFVAVPRLLPDVSAERSPLSLYDSLKEEDLGLYVEDASPYVREAVEKLGLKAVSEVLGIGRRSLRETLRKPSFGVRVTGLARLARRAGLEIDSTRLYLRARNYRTGKIPAVIPVTPSLMRVIGYWVSEGMSGKGLRVFNSDSRVREDVARCVERAFGLRARNHRQDRTRVDINSRPLELVLRRVLGLRGGAGNKKIPDIVMQQPVELLKEFLKAYFTGDGSVQNDVDAMTKSRVLAGQLLYALLRIGVVARVSRKVVDAKTYFRVSVFGRENAARFQRSVGFLNDNQLKLESYVRKETPAHTNVDTIPGIAPLLKECLQFSKGEDRNELWGDWHSYWSSPKRMGRGTLLTYIERTGTAGALREKLLSLAYSDMFWDEVSDVTQIDCKERYVYDLEVPGAENFVGGRGGLFLHNTTTINCLALFIKPEAKIVTMEDTPEINLAHKNWIQSVARQGMAGMGEVTLYDLLRAALRQRPDFIIPGEVRGEEAQTMFQAISTGHAGMSSIHADSIQAVFNRLTNPPMSIPRTLLPALSIVMLQGRVTLKGKPARRILSVTEVVGLDPRSNELITNELYRYSAETDSYTYAGRSYTLERLAKTKGMSMAELNQELATRKQILQWMASKGLRKYREVADVVRRYYTDRPSLLAELGAIAA